MKRWVALAAALVLGLCALYPKAGFTEDRDTVMLAQAIYALARDESYETKLAIGTVAMNRVDNPWFANTLRGVLNEQHQFPVGTRYDAESLSAAHDVLAGRRALDAGTIYYQAVNATDRRQDQPVKRVGGFDFYNTDRGI